MLVRILSSVSTGKLMVRDMDIVCMALASSASFTRAQPNLEPARPSCLELQEEKTEMEK
jgi:hypothetical protein